MHLLKAIMAVVVCLAAGCSCSGGDYASAVDLDTTFAKASDSLESEDYSASLDAYLRFIRIADHKLSPDDSRLAMAYLRAAGIHLMYGDASSAAEFYQKGLMESRRLSNDSLENIFLLNLVSTFYELNDAEKTAEFNTEFSRKAATPEHKFYAAYNAGLIDFMRGDNMHALGVMQRVIDLADSLNVSPELKIYPAGGIAAYFEEAGETDSAISWYKKSLAFAELCDVSNRAFVKRKAFDNLVRMYARKNAADSMFRYYDLRKNMEDSVFDINRFLTLKTGHSSANERISAAHISGLSRTVNYQRMAIFAIVILLVAVALFSYVVVRQSRVLKRKNKMLFERNRELAMMEKRGGVRPLPMVLEKKESLIDNVSEASYLKAPDELWDRIQHYLAECDDIFTPGFTLTSLAKALDSNTNYVSNSINRNSGKNFPSLLNEYRIREACRRMAAPQYKALTLEALANSVGYKSKTTFFDAFKTIVGMSPSAYRKFQQAES